MKESSTDKRKAILDAALTLFTERGFHGTPTSLIAKNAGVAGGTLFCYFKNKEELIESLYLSIINEVEIVLSSTGKIQGDWENRLENICETFVVWGVENPQKIYFMQQFYYSPFSSKPSHYESGSYFLFFVDQINIGIKDSRIKRYPSEIISSIILSGLINAINFAKYEKDPIRQRQIIRSSIDMILHGIIQK